jgi:Flp pilus assembly protein TadD
MGIVFLSLLVNKYRVLDIYTILRSRIGINRAMAKTEITKQKKLLPAIVLAMCCTHLYAAPLNSRLQEAQEKLREQSVKQGEHPRALLFEAMTLYKEKQYVESVRKLERSLALNERDPDVHKLIGLNLVSLGKEDLAGRYFETAVELAPRDFMARYYLGLYQLSNKYYARAEAEFREVIKLSPNYVDAYILLGVAEEQRGKEVEAIRTYRQAIELSERQELKQETPFLYLARLLILLQSYEQSLQPLKRAVEINPKSSEAHKLLGRSLNQLCRYEEALPVLQEAVKLGPQDKNSHYLLMSVYKKLGKSDEAQREMRLFLELEEQEKKK